MKIDRKQLLKALDIVKPGLSNKEAIEQSSTFAFIKGRVVTYNDEISVSHPLPELEDIEGVIDADKLFSILSRYSTDEVEMSLNEKSQIVIKSGRAKAGLTLQTEIRLPLDQEVSEKGKWHPLPRNFVEAVSFVMTAASRDPSKPMLGCVHVRKVGVVEATDSYQLAQFELESSVKIEDTLIPATSIVKLIKLENVHMVAEGNGWIHFKTKDDTVFSCRILSEDTFPDTAPAFKLEGSQLVMPKTINDILDRAAVFSKRDNVLSEEVIISVEDKRLKVSSKDGVGWFEEDVNANYKGSSFAFALAPYLLKTILNKTQACIVSKNKLKFEGTGWQYVALLRIV